MNRKTWSIVASTTLLGLALGVTGCSSKMDDGKMKDGKMSTGGNMMDSPKMDSPKMGADGNPMMDGKMSTPMSTEK